MAYDCIPVKLSDWFYNYGKFLARYPLPFIIVPPLLTCLLMLGVLRINVETDVEYLYATVDAPAKEERAYFRDTFLSNEGKYCENQTRILFVQCLFIGLTLVLLVLPVYIMSNVLLL